MTANFGLPEGYTINEAAPTETSTDHARSTNKDPSLLDQTFGPQASNRLTVELLETIMFTQNYEAKLNVISQEVEVFGKTSTGRKMDFEDLVTTLHSLLAGRLKGCTLDTLAAYTSHIAKNNEYNPVLSLLEVTQWDGSDRFKDVFSLLGIENDDLSCALVRKWLLQTVALQFNSLEDPFGAEGVLVLNGAQGVGKTSFFRHLAIKPSWFLEGACIKDNDKDTTRRIVTRWISELGEVESTLKSDISALKAFVTSDTDTYRLPYARIDRKTARKTSLCATCNSDRYLIDPTGNRRWWSVPVEKRMDYSEIQKLDALQLWAQVYTIVSALPANTRAACFRLTAQEQHLLAVRNGEFEKPVKGEMECRDIIEAARESGALWAYMTITQWKKEHADALRPYSAEQIGKALAKIGIQQKRKRLDGQQSASKVYELPTNTTEQGNFLRIAK